MPHSVLPLLGLGLGLPSPSAPLEHPKEETDRVDRDHSLTHGHAQPPIFHRRRPRRALPGRGRRSRTRCRSRQRRARRTRRWRWVGAKVEGKPLIRSARRNGWGVCGGEVWIVCIAAPMSRTNHQPTPTDRYQLCVNRWRRRKWWRATRSGRGTLRRRAAPSKRGSEGEGGLHKCGG